MKFEISQTEYVPHPQGMHTGVIDDIADQGERESTFEGRTRMVHKVSIDIESDSAFMEDGRPFVHREFCALSSDHRAKLVRLRQALLQRPLTEDEKRSFDPDTEMRGRRVQYVIEHTYKNGKTYASIASWSLQGGNGAPPGASPTRGAGGGGDDSRDADAGATDTPKGDSTPTEDDLPF